MTTALHPGLSIILLLVMLTLSSPLALLNLASAQSTTIPTSYDYVFFWTEDTAADFTLEAANVPTPVCPDGQHYDPWLRTCLPNPDCPDGQHYDVDLRDCVPNDAPPSEESGEVGHDSGGESMPLEFSIVDPPDHGTLTDPENIDGDSAAVSYTPNRDYYGQDTFSFKVNDGKYDSNVANVVINLKPVNDAPVASAQSATTDEGVSKTLTVTATDVDGDPLKLLITDEPDNGAIINIENLTSSSFEVTYEPNSGFSGSDHFSYAVTDGAEQSAPVEVGINVNEIGGDTPEGGTSIGLSVIQPSNRLLEIRASVDPVVPDESVTVSMTDTDGNPIDSFLLTPDSDGQAFKSWHLYDESKYPAGIYTVRVQYMNANFERQIEIVEEDVTQEQFDFSVIGTSSFIAKPGDGVYGAFEVRLLSGDAEPIRLSCISEAIQCKLNGSFDPISVLPTAAVSYELAIPDDLSPGSYQMIMRGEYSHGTIDLTRDGYLPFTIEGSSTPTEQPSDTTTPTDDQRRLSNIATNTGSDQQASETSAPQASSDIEADAIVATQNSETKGGRVAMVDNGQTPMYVAIGLGVAGASAGLYLKLRPKHGLTKLDNGAITGHEHSNTESGGDALDNNRQMNSEIQQSSQVSLDELQRLQEEIRRRRRADINDPEIKTLETRYKELVQQYESEHPLWDGSNNESSGPETQGTLTSQDTPNLPKPDKPPLAKKDPEVIFDNENKKTTVIWPDGTKEIVEILENGDKKITYRDGTTKTIPGPHGSTSGQASPGITTNTTPDDPTNTTKRQQELEDELAKIARELRGKRIEIKNLVGKEDDESQKQKRELEHDKERLMQKQQELQNEFEGLEKKTGTDIEKSGQDEHAGPSNRSEEQHIEELREKLGGLNADLERYTKNSADPRELQNNTGEFWIKMAQDTQRQINETKAEIKRLGGSTKIRVPSPRSVGLSPQEGTALFWKLLKVMEAGDRALWEKLLDGFHDWEKAQIEISIKNSLDQLSKGERGVLYNYYKNAMDGKIPLEKALEGYDAGHVKGKATVKAGITTLSEYGVNDPRNLRPELREINRNLRGFGIEGPLVRIYTQNREKGLSQSEAKLKAIEEVVKRRATSTPKIKGFLAFDEYCNKLLDYAETINPEQRPIFLESLEKPPTAKIQTLELPPWIKSGGEGAASAGMWAAFTMLLTALKEKKIPTLGETSLNLFYSGAVGYGLGAAAASEIPIIGFAARAFSKLMGALAVPLLVLQMESETAQSNEDELYFTREIDKDISIDIYRKTGSTTDHIVIVRRGVGSVELYGDETDFNDLAQFKIKKMTAHLRGVGGSRISIDETGKTIIDFRYEVWLKYDEKGNLIQGDPDLFYRKVREYLEDRIHVYKETVETRKNDIRKDEEEKEQNNFAHYIDYKLNERLEKEQEELKEEEEKLKQLEQDLKQLDRNDSRLR